MAFAILDAYLTHDIVNVLAENIHKENFSGVSMGIKALRDVTLERALQAFPADPVGWMAARKDMRVYLDIDWVDWDTVILRINGDRFIIYHHYIEMMDEDRLLMECTLEGSSLKVEKFFYDREHWQADDKLYSL
jgi:hypothetical protein